MRNSPIILLGKPEGTLPIVRSRCVWEDNIKTDLKGIGVHCVNCVYVTQDKYGLQASCVHCNEPSRYIKAEELLARIFQERLSFVELVKFGKKVICGWCS
jgi:hypothetical protein